MSYLQSLLDLHNMPLFSAFILGLMTAISPCPLATNITAIAFIGKNIENRKRVFFNGLIYTLGMAFSYTLLGLILYFGASKFHISSFLQRNGERFLGPLLLIVGFLMLGIVKINFPGLGKLTDKFQKRSKTGNFISSFLLGFVFALAFCPYTGVLYFGMLIPITISSSAGLFLPFVFALAMGLPVIFISYLIAYTLSGVGKFYSNIKSFEKWLRYIVAAIFMLAGLHFIYIFFIAN